MPLHARERHEEKVGRPCIRADPILATEETIECAGELMSYAADAAGLGGWIWEQHTRGLPDALRHRFFRWVNLYMGEYRRHEGAHARAKAKAKQAGGRIGKR
jgi:hypothetical protein